MKSLQINISSKADAESVIANLPKIKAAYEENECDSVEFFIAEPIRNEIEATVTGAIRWTKTYRRSIPTGEGNVFFELPHYIRPTMPAASRLISPRFAPAELELKVPVTHGKTKRPVTAQALAK